MKKLLTNCIIALLSCVILFAQNKQEEFIIQAALDYADGYYSGDPDRIGGVLHPDFNKIMAYTLPQTGKCLLQHSSTSDLVENARIKNGFVEKEKRNIDVTVLEVRGDVAAAKLTSLHYNDFLQLVRFDGEWKIVNVLRTAVPESPQMEPIIHDTEVEKKVVEEVVHEYFTSVYSGDVDHLEKVIHPEVSIAQLITIPQNGKYTIRRNGSSFIVELCRAGYLKVPEDKREVKVEMLDIMDEMAFARAKTARSNIYFQLQRINKNWQVINILSIPILKDISS